MEDIIKDQNGEPIPTCSAMMNEDCEMIHVCDDYKEK